MNIRAAYGNVRDKMILDVEEAVRALISRMKRSSAVFFCIHCDVDHDVESSQVSSVTVQPALT